jgi:hypothetical protein
LTDDLSNQFKNKWKIIKNPFRDPENDSKRRSSNMIQPHFIVVKPGIYTISKKTSQGELKVVINIKMAKLGYDFDFDISDLRASKLKGYPLQQ